MWTEPGEQHPHEAGYHGLASIAVAGILLSMALPALQLAFLLQVADYPGWGRSDKELAAYGGYVGAAVVEVLCLAGVWVGVRGLGAAGRTGESRVLCGVGVVLCLFAAALWVMCAVAWHSQAARFIR